MLDYFYGNQTELFSFFRIPRALFVDERFRNLSCDAKVLYGLLLDRLSLSQKNGWVDDENRVYVFYRVEELAESLGCCREKAGKLLNELGGKNGAGLLERKRRGQGKPDMLYVKNFISKDTSTSASMNMSEDDIQKSEIPTSETLEDTKESISEHEQAHSYRRTEQPRLATRDYTPFDMNLLSACNASVDSDSSVNKHGSFPAPVYGCHFQMSKYPTSRSRILRHPDVVKTDTNYTKSNYTESNNMLALSLSNPSNRIQNGNGQLKKRNITRDIRSYCIPDYDITIAYVREQIEYDVLSQEYGDSGVMHELVLLMADVLSSTKRTWRIAGEDRPTELVQERLRQLNSLHIQYVISCFLANSTEVRNIRQYLLTALFNAPVTMESYYVAKSNINFNRLDHHPSEPVTL